MAVRTTGIASTATPITTVRRLTEGLHDRLCDRATWTSRGVDRWRYSTDYISYRNSRGIPIEDEPVYYSGSSDSNDRGFLEVHVNSQGIRVAKGTYTAVTAWTFTVWPTGRMTVR